MTFAKKPSGDRRILVLSTLSNHLENVTSNQQDAFLDLCLLSVGEPLAPNMQDAAVMYLCSIALLGEYILVSVSHSHIHD